jgi:hypothetical protein
MARKWIAKATKHKGALRRSLGIKKGKKIGSKRLHKVAKQHTKSGKLTVNAKRARLALTLGKFRHR